MSQVVGTAEDEVEVDILLLGDMVDRRMGGLQLLVVGGQEYRSLRIGLVADLTLGDGQIGVGDEVTLVYLTQLHPVPITDGVVEMIGHIVVDQHAVVILGLIGILQRRAVFLVGLGRVIVGVEVHLHVLEFHLTVRGCIDVQRYLLGLAVGVSHTGIGGDILIVDVTGTTDEPVMGGGGIRTLVGIAGGIAVVDDLLHVMHEVTGGLHFLQVGIAIGEHLIRDSLGMSAGLFIIRGEDGTVVARGRAGAMHILGIDITAAETGLHIDQFQLSHTGDVAPVLFLRRALLGGQFEIDTRGEGHAVGHLTVVTLTLLREGLLPLVEGLAVGRIVVIVGDTRRPIEVHIAGQTAHVVHDTVNAEIVAVGLERRIALTGEGLDLIE